METTELSRWVTLGPEVGSDIVSALRAVGVSLDATTWIEGAGELGDPVVWARAEQGERVEKRLSGVWDLVSLRGHVSQNGDHTLYVLLARDAEVVGGRLASGRVVTASLRASVTAPRTEAPRSAPREEPAAPPSPRPPEAGAPPAPAPGAAPQVLLSPTLPKRPGSRSLEPEFYPEEGDVVTHFAFGRCLVVTSDGERLRLQQERDGRVREVALSMLRIEEPTTLEGGKRHFELQRKN